MVDLINTRNTSCPERKKKRVTRDRFTPLPTLRASVPHFNILVEPQNINHKKKRNKPLFLQMILTTVMS